MQQQPDVRVGEATAYEEDCAAKCIGTKPHIEWGIEGKPVEIIRFGQDEGRILIEVAMELDDVGNPLAGLRCIACIGHLDVSPTISRTPVPDSGRNSWYR